MNQNYDIHLKRHSLLVIFQYNNLTMTLILVSLIFICFYFKIMTLITSVIIFITFKTIFSLISLAINPNITI